MTAGEEFPNLNNEFSDRPKFGSFPVPVEILTVTEKTVSVSAKLAIPVLAEVSVQMCTEICQIILLYFYYYDENIIISKKKLNLKVSIL